MQNTIHEGTNRATATRYIFSSTAIDALESFFCHTPYPTRAQRLALALELDAPHQQVKNWFQNRRARYKKQQQKAMGLQENPINAMEMHLKGFYKRTVGTENASVAKKKKRSSPSSQSANNSSLLANLIHQRSPNRVSTESNTTKQPLLAIIDASINQTSRSTLMDGTSSLEGFNQQQFSSASICYPPPPPSCSENNNPFQTHYYSVMSERNTHSLPSWKTPTQTFPTSFAFQNTTYTSWQGPLNYSTKPLDLSAQSTRRSSSSTSDTSVTPYVQELLTDYKPELYPYRPPSTTWWQLLSETLSSPTYQQSATKTDHHFTDETRMSRTPFPRQSASSTHGRTSSPNSFGWNTSYGDPFPRYLQSVGSLSDLDQNEFITQFLQNDTLIEDDVFIPPNRVSQEQE